MCVVYREQPRYTQSLAWYTVSSLFSFMWHLRLAVTLVFTTTKISYLNLHIFCGQALRNHECKARFRGFRCTGRSSFVCTRLHKVRNVSKFRPTSRPENDRCNGGLRYGNRSD